MQGTWLVDYFDDDEKRRVKEVAVEIPDAFTDTVDRMKPFIGSHLDPKPKRILTIERRK